MSTEKTLEVIRTFFAKVSSGQSPEAIAESFGPDVDWNIPGASDIAPWVGKRKGRDAVAAFYREFGTYLEPIEFNIKTLMAHYEQGVALGSLECVVRSTGKTITCEFAIEFEVLNEQITRYRFFEDSHGVAVAAQ
ncbi:ketosteroid isomerase-like protein [Pseudomonas hunanensis]|uniref:Ketosteroid isomerase-like protein n=1 Tax=Pseudomonas hunanensis TaxID=1247546 RepID=A0ACC6JY58_9PSED|nr:nuclear transport factor 2 family protein [Pseudomonas hunanensis]MDR6711101.1 ketosteroid isomerase-like protein [Pseudomonas hunanensis]